MSEKCPICGCQTLETKTGDFQFEPPPQIPGGTIIIKNTSWEECTTCSESILSLELEQSIEQERYRRLGLLSPQEIQKIRERVGLSQTHMAQFLGIGEKTYTRWESGKSLHNKSSDNLIRLVEQNPELFEQIEAQRDLHRNKLIGEYIRSLEETKGKKKQAIAAHCGELEPHQLQNLRKQLLEILKLKRNYSN